MVAEEAPPELFYASSLMATFHKNHEGGNATATHLRKHASAQSDRRTCTMAHVESPCGSRPVFTEETPRDLSEARDNIARLVLRAQQQTSRALGWLKSGQS